MLVTRRSKRKASGGLRTSLRARDKKLTELANKPTETTIAKGNEKRKKYRGKGANKKVKAVESKKVNLLLNGKTVSAELATVAKNTAHKEYVRRNILTKGAEIKVKYNGKDYLSKITSRPGQSGIINAIALE